MKTLLNRMIGCLILLVLFPSVAHTSSLTLNNSGPGDQPPPTRSAARQASQVRVTEAYGKLPLSFEANQGQSDPHVKFLSRGRGYTLFLTPTEAVLTLQKTVKSKAGNRRPTLRARLKDDNRAFSIQTTTVRMQLIGANPGPQVTGLEELPGKVNYFIGNDPAKWRTNVSTYAKIKYRDVYPGVDVVYYGNQGQLEYDFVVAPGADPKTITLRFQGADTLEVDDQGDLVLHTGGGEVRLQKPLVYQEVDGVRQEISGGYRLKGQHQVGFQLGLYDAATPLVVDPVLVYSTYLGGFGNEGGFRIAVDPEGNAYVTGGTNSTDFPTANALQPAYGGDFDAFVAKLNPTGSGLVYSTYLGGSGRENFSEFSEEAFFAGGGIAVDPEGNAYVTGFTSSTDFPTANALQPAFGGGDFDAFVAKLNPTGSALVYSTYLGGSGNDQGLGIAVDADGNAYVTGGADSDFPTANALQPPSRELTQLPQSHFLADAFVAKLNPTGSALVYSTRLGGSEEDFAWGIGIDGAGNAYVTGATFSSDFPTANPLQPAFGGDIDAFVTKLDATGSALVYSTYLGGSGRENLSEIKEGFISAGDIAVDADGNAYVTGFTESIDFPTANPLQATCVGVFGCFDAFVAKLNPTGSALVYSTYLGGSFDDNGSGIAVDADGNAYVTGFTDSTDCPSNFALSCFPTANALPNGPFGSAAFVAKLNPTGSALVYSTYLGSTGFDNGSGIAVDADGNAYVTGDTDSTDFPTANPLQPAFGGGDVDAFIAKITEGKKLYFAQFGNGQGIQSDIVLTNPSASNTASGKVDFLDDNTLPLPVGILAESGDEMVKSSVEFSVAPLGAVTISTDGEGDLAVGSAVVTSDTTLGGAIRFNISGVGIAGVGASQPLRGFITPVRRKSGGINTGIAIHNTESQAVTLSFTLRNSQGVEVANGTKTVEDLPAGGHLTQFIDQLFPQAGTSDFEGTLVVQVTDGKVAAAALELGPQAGQFTTLPVTPLN
ncbi:SBBP repeat-containing protein [Acidobacteria bacterium AH-259-O06]|nr:SBBP repeat-containing protein [Acidobacteria bacterium AH-259-O06]